MRHLFIACGPFGQVIYKVQELKMGVQLRALPSSWIRRVDWAEPNRGRAVTAQVKMREAAR